MQGMVTNSHNTNLQERKARELRFKAILDNIVGSRIDSLGYESWSLTEKGNEEMEESFLLTPDINEKEKHQLKL